MYQVVILGNKYYTAALKQSLDLYKVVSVQEDDAVDDKSSATLYLYVGASKTDKEYADSVRLRSLAERQIIYPVVSDTSLFSEVIPQELSSINAIVVPDETRIHRLKNRILQFFGLLDSNLKVFISYKRDDSSALAQLLFDELNKAGYRPFLDSYSIDSGVDFQEYLNHELAESSLFLYLHTTNYERSKWTMEELNNSIRLQLGVVELRTADKNADDFSVHSNDIIIIPQDEDGKIILEAAFLQKVVKSVEKTMYDAYQQKQVFLLSQIKSVFGDIRPKTHNVFVTPNNMLAVMPVSHRPVSQDFERLERLSVVNNIKCQIYSIGYNGMLYRRDVKQHLNWLNKSLPIKAIDYNELSL